MGKRGELVQASVKSFSEKNRSKNMFSHSNLLHQESSETYQHISCVQKTQWSVRDQWLLVITVRSLNLDQLHWQITNCCATLVFSEYNYSEHSYRRFVYVSNLFR